MFSRKLYYIYRSFSYISGPHSIHDDPNNKNGNPLNLKLPSWVTKVDAVMKWKKNDFVYIFFGPYYWKYDDNNKKMSAGYPKLIKSRWRSLPSSGIDAAYSSDDADKTFFIKNNMFYLFDDSKVRVQRNFPVHIGHQWLACDNSTNTFSNIPKVNYTDEDMGDEP